MKCKIFLANSDVLRLYPGETQTGAYLVRLCQTFSQSQISTTSQLDSGFGSLGICTAAQMWSDPAPPGKGSETASAPTERLHLRRWHCCRLMPAI